MGEYKGPSFYDKIFETSKTYNAPYKRCRYFPIWRAIVRRVKLIEDPKILELGCGPGQLAEFLEDEGFNEYTGIDFSPVAIEKARKRSRQRVLLGDIFDKALWPEDYNCVVSTEVLEHVKDDIGLLRKIKRGTQVLASVPSFDCECHVRHFEKRENVFDRYQSVLQNMEVHRLKMAGYSTVLWVVFGTI